MSFKDLLREKILSYGTYFDEEVLEIGLQKFKTIKINAGDHLINSGDVISELFIAEKSISRAYIITENGEERTLWIEPEMSFLTDMESFRRGTTNQMNVQLYEDSDVMYIEREDLVELYAKYHQWSLFGISLAEEYLIYVFKITNLMFANDATSNYQLIEQYYPRFLDIVPLKHIASRLNISPISISRIRNDKQKRKLD
ncbi:cyclic nucleotide-binding domain-containing protein [Soonwooa sp.]|uniref:Crp/Fnr family transcriptional regulator n=1 Tax=Soonwooa sp. TaxID=1938592 RepID=UPI0026298273|nr:cyclic nucleotide-binding domain-containing protein [Soonwooa sp.]